MARFTADFKGHKVRWMWLFKKIVREAPYSRMMGAKIEKGCIVSWKKLQVMKKFKKVEEDVSKVVPKHFDKHWQYLFLACQKAWDDTFDIYFADGRPMVMHGSKPGALWDGAKFAPLIEKAGAGET